MLLTCLCIDLDPPSASWAGLAQHPGQQYRTIYRWLWHWTAWPRCLNHPWFHYLNRWSQERDTNYQGNDEDRDRQLQANGSRMSHYIRPEIWWHSTSSTLANRCPCSILYHHWQICSLHALCWWCGPASHDVQPFMFHPTTSLPRFYFPSAFPCIV